MNLRQKRRQKEKKMFIYSFFMGASVGFLDATRRKKMKGNE